MSGYSPCCGGGDLARCVCLAGLARPFEVAAGLCDSVRQVQLPRKVLGIRDLHREPAGADELHVRPNTCQPTAAVGILHRELQLQGRRRACVPQLYSAKYLAYMAVWMVADMRTSFRFGHSSAAATATRVNSLQLQ